MGVQLLPAMLFRSFIIVSKFLADSIRVKVFEIAKGKIAKFEDKHCRNKSTKCP
jgi:hypothetical protein